MAVKKYYRAKQRPYCFSFQRANVSSRLPVFILSPTRAVYASPVYLVCQSAATAIDSIGNAFRHLPYETMESGVLWQLLTFRSTWANVRGELELLFWWPGWWKFSQWWGSMQTEDRYRFKVKPSLYLEEGNPTGWAWWAEITFVPPSMVWPNFGGTTQDGLNGARFSVFKPQNSTRS